MYRMVNAPHWTSTTFAEALVDLLEEPFATPEDVGLDVRRVETVDEAGPGAGDEARGLGRVRTIELDLADGARFRLAVERLA